MLCFLLNLVEQSQKYTDFWKCSSFHYIVGGGFCFVLGFFVAIFLFFSVAAENNPVKKIQLMDSKLI